MKRRIRCMFFEDQKITRYTLRRYGGTRCGIFYYHNAHSPVIAETPDLPNPDGIRGNNPPEKPAKDDPRWPTKCERCEYQFTDTDEFQIFPYSTYRNTETGEIVRDDLLPVGAMYYGDWNLRFYGPGPDGHCLVVRMPGQINWCMDGEASNCTRKGDKTHKCWIREGAVPNVTAGKNGNTCSAGAGSIAVPDFHGFLRNGWLEEC